MCTSPLLPSIVVYSLHAQFQTETEIPVYVVLFSKISSEMSMFPIVDDAEVTGDHMA